MKLMIDTNIVIDVLTNREPFSESSIKVLQLCENQTLQGFISASSVTDVFYLLHRHLHNNELAYQKLGYILEIVGVLPVTPYDVMDAFLKKASDFEDCLLTVCALANNCQGIVTRNQKDFAGFGLDLFSPDEILARFPE